MHKKIGDILLEMGVLTAAEVGRMHEIQTSEGGSRRFGEIAVEQGTSEDKVLEALAIQFRLPVVDLKDYADEVPLEKISFSFLENNLLLPLTLQGNTLTVAIADPTHAEGVDALRSSFGYEVELFLAKKSDILERLQLQRGSRNAVMQRLIEDAAEDEAAGPAITGEISHLKDLAQEKGIIQLVNIIIENAVKDRASDIHIEPGELTVRARYRIDGVLYEKEVLPMRTYSAISSRIKLLAQMNIAERRLPQDGRIKASFSGKEIDIRVSTLPTIHGESIVMRLLDKGTAFVTLEDLGFDRVILDIYEQMIKRPYGMILITGPTGSGKSTTLYASLDKINTPEKKIITIEEPVEYLMPGINQIQVRPKIGLTFAGGLRHIVRQDPDVIMVGEIRDMETAGIAIHAALTGHLLYSTLHTNDAPGAVTRLMDMGIENYLVASTLIGVIAQRLVRKICEHCAESRPVTGDAVKRLDERIERIWHGAGCEHCAGTGYRGRIGIFEMLPVEDEIRNLIMERATVKEIKDMAMSLGMRTLREDGIQKVIRGVTTIDEVLRVTQVEL